MNIIRNLEILEKILAKNRCGSNRFKDKVRRIVEDVAVRGDEAVLAYTRKFDGVKISVKEMRVSESEISAAFNDLNSSLIAAFKVAIDNVTAFYRAQRFRTNRIRRTETRQFISRYLPLERVGVYVPAGTAPLVSTVYMSVIPAIVAGVKEIVLFSPPRKDKSVNSYILAVASLLKIKEIYRVGGAQAIAAMAYGTRTIKKVDKIIGPGNQFVTEAKRLVFGQVDIDMLAGPSEIVIIASKDANPDYITADLEAQIEHRDGLGVVVTNSAKIINELRDRKTPGFALRVRNFEEACQAANRIAPEHLEILTKNPQRLLKHIRNAGAIFLGDSTPVALGDYLAGPSHVLPTGGSARFFSALSVREFLKEIHVLRYSRKALQEDAAVLEKIAGLEGMVKHIESVKIRLGKPEE